MNQTKSALVCLLLSLAMLLNLTACGRGKGENKDGVMKLEDYELLYKSACIMQDYEGMDAIVVTLDFTNNSKESVTYIWSINESFKQNGQDLVYATIFTDVDSYSEVIDGQFEEVAPGETIEVKSAYRLVDTTSKVEIVFSQLLGDKEGKLTIDPSTLSRESVGGSAPGSGITLPAGGGETLLDWWNGDWYGWWVMTGCSGYYADEGMEGSWWDICGTVSIGEDNTGTVVLWDTDYDINRPMVSAQVSLSPDGVGEYGSLMSEGGYFTDISLEHADWIVDPGLVEIPDLLYINGYYENGEDEYTYDIYLRPWGSTWDDVGEDIQPDSYYDWYLPMIEAGMPMPGSFNAVPPTGGGGTAVSSSSPAAPAGNVPGGDGIVTQEQVEKGYVWMSEVAKDIYSTTYEELVDYFGVEGQFDKEEYSDHMQENRRYYKWISSENSNHFIYVNFAEREPGVFVVCAFNTSGFSGSEAKAKYLDIVKAEAAELDKAAAADTPMKNFTLEVTQFAKDDVKVTITTTIPESGWSSTKDSLVENEDPTAFGAGEMVFTVRDSVEKFDNNKSSFKNYQDIEDRVIGGITFKGRTYEYIGYSWIEYVAQIDEGRALSIGLAKMDCFPGTMPDIILNNMQFK